MGQDFDKCPARVGMEDRRLVAALAVEAEAFVQPLSNWPEGYSAWMVELLGELKRARQSRERAMYESAQKKTDRR